MFPLRDANPHRTTPYVTYGLIGVNLLVFVYGLQLELPEAERFLLVYSFVPQLFFENPFSSAYRLLSSLFLHGGWAHLLGNMFFLFVFGDNIEDRLGRGRYLLFYLVGGVAATLLHALFTPAPTDGVGAGALPGPGGAAPGPEFTIKGNADSMLFHTPESPYYERTRAEVWFRTPEEAAAAGFTEWRSHRRTS